MGDRTSVQIEIGGKLTAAQLTELAEAAAGDWLTIEWGNGPELNAVSLFAHAAGGSLVLTGHEINYGNVEGVETFCRDHGLTYRKEWDAGGGYGAGGEFYRPGRDVLEYVIGQIGAPSAITALEIRAFGSWEALMDHLAAIEGDLPPLEIDEAADLAQASAGFTCTGCGRDEHACSVEPCEAVQSDRDAPAGELGDIVAVPREHLKALHSAATRYADDLESGLSDGTYDDRADLDDVLKALDATAEA